MTNGKAGDIIFFRSDGSWWDIFIKIVSPNYTHVGMFINDSEIIEASIRGVGVRQYSRKWNANIKRIVNVRDWQISDGVRFALSHIGETYSVLGATKAGLLRLLGLTHIADKIDPNWDCSEFVATVIRFGMGINIVERISTEEMTPDDLFGSSILESIK